VTISLLQETDIIDYFNFKQELPQVGIFSLTKEKKLVDSPFEW